MRTIVFGPCGALRASTRAGPVKASTRKPLRNSACLPTYPAALPRTASWASGLRICHGGSDAVLEGFDRVGLHNLARRLCLHHDDFAEDLALASLRRRLCPRLQPAQARQCEDTRLGNLRSRQLRQAVDHLRAHGLLQLA